MTEKQLGVEGLSDDTNVVLSKEKAAKVGCERSLTVGELRKVLAEKKRPKAK